MSMNTTRILRHVNVQSCLRILKDRGPMSRADLARELGTTRATVGYAVRELMEAGLVSNAEQPTDGSQKGRPGTAIALNPGAAYFIGVELAADHLTVVIADFLLKPVEIVRTAIDLKTGEVDEVLRAVLDQTDKLLARAKIAKRDVYGIGLSMGGIVTPDGRAFIPSAHRRWHGVNVAQLLEQRMRRRWVVKCCNNAAAVALTIADKLAENDKENLLVVLLATRGVGSAHVRKGIVDKGSHGMAGEIGMMYLGEQLSSVDRTFQNAPSYVQLAKFLDSSSDPVAPLSGPAAAEAAGSPFADALAQWGEVITTALLNAIYLLDPAAIVVAGPLAVLYPHIQERVDAALRARILPGLEVPIISFAETNQHVAALGAAAMLRQGLFLLPHIAVTSSMA
jgi:predicted NBD/HSP70 family sugar kinase